MTITIGSVVEVACEVERRGKPDLSPGMVGKVMDVTLPGEELFGRAHIMPVYQVHFYGGQMIEFLNDDQVLLVEGGGE
jgi:hypothetical protein